MNFEDLTKEQQILVNMRKVLTSIIREITPEPGEKYPLSDKTVEDIRQCLTMIALREKELAEIQGTSVSERPYYVDEPPMAQDIPFDQWQHRKKIEH
jgi:hypothetical protein